MERRSLDSPVGCEIICSEFVVVVFEIDPFAGTDIGKNTMTLLSLNSNMFDSLPYKYTAIVCRNDT